MTQTPIRFVLSKSALEYLEENQAIIKNKEVLNGIVNKQDFVFQYEWDQDFAKYFRLDTKKIRDFTDSYKNIELLLKNIHFEAILWNVEKFFNTFTQNTSSEKSIFLIHQQPLEMVFIWKILENLWYKNIVYSFNKELYINSNSHTLEWVLLLLAFNKSPYLQKILASFGQKFWTQLWNISKDSYFYFDENDMVSPSKMDGVHTYIQWQIWYKTPKTIFRIDKYVDKDFVLSKNIKNIVLFDSEQSFWSSYKYLKQSLKWEKDISLKEIIYPYSQWDFFWYYEEYVLTKNKEYLDYKYNIQQKNEGVAAHLKKNISSQENLPERRPAYNQEKFQYPHQWISFISFLPFWIGILILIIYILAHLPSTNYGGGYYGWWWSSWGWGGYIWGGGSFWGGSDSSISTPSSSSSIKSFGWGGFSKSSG